MATSPLIPALRRRGVPARRDLHAVAPPLPAPATAPPREWIPFQRPELPPADEVMAYFQASIDAGAYANGGPCVNDLAARIEERLGFRARCVPVSSATTGLMATLRALCGSPNSRRRMIACPSYTFTATAGAIAWAGFEPLFCDIEPDGFGLDPDKLDSALRARPGRMAGILACSPFGTAPAAMLRAAWAEVAQRHGIPLIVDSAPGFGAIDEFGDPLGSQGDTEVFSFHATKPFAIGEGGAVVTADPEVASRIARIVNFGLDPGTRTSIEPGLNAKLSEIHAATGLAVMDRFDAILGGRRSLAQRLQARLAGSGLTFQRGNAGSTWQYFQSLAPDEAAREAILVAAADGAVDARTLHDPPLHRHPAFAAVERGGWLQVTERLAARSVSLPLANALDDGAVERIAAVAGARAC
ncbi:MAG: hypothetical protein QOJ89_454 [bacterium]